MVIKKMSLEMSPNEALIDSIDAGNLDTVIEAISAGANLNIEDSAGIMPLILAAELGHTAIVEYLIKSGANVNARNRFGFTAWKMAMKEDYPIIINLLANAGGTKEGNSHFEAVGTPNEILIAAAMGNEVAALEKALADGAFVDVRSSINRTPLIYAAQSGHIESMKVLIKHGANINAIDKFGQTALRVAAWGRYVEAVSILLESKANVNEKNEKADTIIMQFVTSRPNGKWAKEYLRIAELLIRAGANIYEVSEDGSSLLVLASQNGHADLVNLLSGKIN